MPTLEFHRPACARTATLLVLLIASFWMRTALASASVKPAADLADAIRQNLEQDFAENGTSRASPRDNLETLLRFYSNRHYAPLWLSPGPLANQIDDLLAAAKDSARHGLPLAPYRLDAISALRGRPSLAGQARLEILLSDALLSQARDRAIGATTPQWPTPAWGIAPATFDAPAFLNSLANGSRSVTAALQELWPKASEYWALLERRKMIQDSGDRVTHTISAGPSLSLGDQSPRVIELKQRLYGPGDHDATFDAALRGQLISFQRAAGLEGDGVLGPNTIATLNAGSVDWIDRIDANLERWRWLPRQQPQTFIRVNIAAFRLRVIDGPGDALAMDIIAGKAARQTPVFVETLKYLVFSPYWNLPHKIAREDKLPLLQRDAAALAAQGYEARRDATHPFQAVSAFNWAGVTRNHFNFQMRQKPGPQNALGRVKFMLPNAHAVYLHDTPNHELFAKTERNFSSGCIRLSRPAELARWLLERDGNQLASSIDSLMAQDEPRTVYLRRPLPVWIVYFTAFVDESGEVIFRRDVYERDRHILAALRQHAPSLRQ